MNLFELTNEQLQIKNVLEEYENQNIEEGKLNEMLKASFDNKKNYFDKVKSYYFLIKNFQMFVDKAKEEKQRIDEIKKTYENRINRLKEVLKNSMLITDNKKIEFENGKVYLKKTASKLNIKNEKDVPEIFFKVKKEIDKSYINSEYKNVDKLPNWLERVDNDNSIILK